MFFVDSNTKSVCYSRSLNTSMNRSDTVYVTVHSSRANDVRKQYEVTRRCGTRDRFVWVQQKGIRVDVRWLPWTGLWQEFAFGSGGTTRRDKSMSLSIPTSRAFTAGFHPIMELLCQISVHLLLYSHLNLALWKLCRSIVSLSDPSISNDYVLRK